MNYLLNANKRELSLYDRIFERLKKLDKTNGFRIVRFPQVYYQLGMYFHFSKNETNVVLKELESLDLIRIVPFNGIKIRK